jgi:hypothetical protein
VLTGKGPYENLLDHLSNPTGNNILTNFGEHQFTHQLQIRTREGYT